MAKIDDLIAKVEKGRQYRAAAEFRALEGGDAGAMIVKGHACTFNEPYVLFRIQNYTVWEQIAPGAFVDCDLSDVIMQYDHEGRVMARQKNGTLQLEVDKKGLAVTADLSKSELGAGLYRDIKAGMIDTMSLGFHVAKDKREITENKETGKIDVLRTITKIDKVYDVSAVSIPANGGTDISARSFCDGVIAELEAERLKAQETERRKMLLALKIKTMEVKAK